MGQRYFAHSGCRRLNNLKNNNNNIKMGDIGAMNQQRIERDTKELQKMIEQHFEGRKVEDEDFDKFKTHLEERKSRRAGEVEARAEKEKKKKKAEEAEKAAREQAEADAKAAKEESKAAAFVPDKNKYKRTDEQKANCWNSKISDLYVKMHRNVM